MKLFTFRRHRRSPPAGPAACGQALRAVGWRLCLERLEDRILLSGGSTATAPLLAFTAFQTAQAAGFLASSNAVDLYRISLNTGDEVAASISAQAAGSGLQSLLRVFDANGNQVALDDQEGGDPRLTFQARRTDDYFVGVSASGDSNYDPHVANSGHGGMTTGLYTLNLQRTRGVDLQPDLAGSSFRLAVDAAAYGDTLPVAFTVENRGGADADAFDIDLVLSRDSRLDTSAGIVLQTLSLPGLASGQSMDETLAVALPDAATALAAGLPISGPVVVGLRIDPAGAIQELNPHDQHSVHRGEDWGELTIVMPMSASGNNHSQASADALPDLNSRVSGVLTAGQADLFQFQVVDNGRLTARVEPETGSNLVARVSLSDFNGDTLIQSEQGLSASGGIAALAQRLQPGTYYLAVSAQAGAGAYHLITNFVSDLDPLAPLDAGLDPVVVAVTDLDGDGRPDLIASDHEKVRVLLGSGAGDFRSQEIIDLNATLEPGGLLPLLASAVAVADVNGDGRPDVIVTSQISRYDPQSYTYSTYSAVRVLLNNGAGTFQSDRISNLGDTLYYTTRVAVADFNGDGLPDLALGGTAFTSGNVPQPATTIRVLQGIGDGSFGSPKVVNTDTALRSFSVADINGDGRPDLVLGGQVANLSYGSNNDTVSILLGNGDGTFQPSTSFDVSQFLDSVTVGDVNGDGHADLILGEIDSFVGVGDSLLDVLLGKGDGSFQPSQNINLGENTLPSSQVTLAPAIADLNGDGKPDLSVIVRSDGIPPVTSVRILLGTGDGKFMDSILRPLSVDGGPSALTVADMNGDGQPDLVLGSPYETFLAADKKIRILFGSGDGAFRPTKDIDIGANASTTAVADVNSDGRPDIILSNRTRAGTMSILPGSGDGTFQGRQAFSIGNYPSSVLTADINGDGRPDLVVLSASGVGLLLGDGDGTFQPQKIIASGSPLALLALADVNGDSRPDIVLGRTTGDFLSPTSTMEVLLGNGNATFQPPQILICQGINVTAVQVGDLNGDGRADLVATGTLGHLLNVFLGNGDGMAPPATGSTFQPAMTFDPGRLAESVVLGDINGDGRADVLMRDTLGLGNTINVMFGDAVSILRPGKIVPVGATTGNNQPAALADVNGDGRPDLLLSILGFSRELNVLLGKGDGTFQAPRSVSLGAYANSVTPVDVNGDGRLDLVVSTSSSLLRLGEQKVIVLLGDGNGDFSITTSTREASARNTPLLADLDGDQIPDSAILDRSGKLLFRKGLPGSNNRFASPIVLNDSAQVGEFRPARDVTALRTGSGRSLAVADVGFDRRLSTGNHLVYTVWLVGVAANGDITRSPAFSSTLLPTRLAAGDLTGNGLDDLVTANALDDTVTVAFQVTPGQFSAPVSLPVGRTPSDIALLDVNGDKLPDIVVTDQASGDVSVLLNDGSHSFARAGRFRAGTNLYSLDTTATPAIKSLQNSVSLTGADFTGDGIGDLVVVNRGSHSFSVLPGSGSGGFSNTRAALTTSTSDGFAVNNRPGAIVAGDFNRDGKADVAILMEDRAEVWIFTGHGDGSFTHTASIMAGSLPTGLTLVAGNGPRLLDLLVGNQFGDILRLVGNGDGTFRPPAAFTGDHVPLDVRDLGNGRPDAIVANQQANQVSIQAMTDGGLFGKLASTLSAADPARQLAPGAVLWAKLDQNSPFFDAVVVASGSNDVLVYRGTGFDAAGNPTFDLAKVYTVGTNPVDVTIQDLTGDGIADMVVSNQGSNDVSVLFGSFDGSGSWLGTSGPRLASGGSGPIATTLRDMNGDNILDLVVTNGQSGNFAVLPGVGQGFFDDRSPLLLNIPGNPSLGTPVIAPSGQGVIGTGNGSIVGFNLDNFDATVRTVFEGAEVNALTLFEGEVIAALGNGTVLDLRPDTTGLLTIAGIFQPLNDVPSDPTALEVLQLASGIEVLVTSAGQDRIFVFASPTAPPALEPIVSFFPTVEVAVASAESLTLVATLVADVLPSQPSIAAQNAAASGGGDENSPATIEAIPGEGRVPGLDAGEILRQLELFEKTRDPDSDPRSFRGPSPQSLAPDKLDPPWMRPQLASEQMWFEPGLIELFSEHIDPERWREDATGNDLGSRGLDFEMPELSSFEELAWTRPSADVGLWSELGSADWIGRPDPLLE